MKSWLKFNESIKELSEDMVLDLVFFYAFSIFGSGNNNIQDIQENISYLLDLYGFNIDDLIFTDRDGYFKTLDSISKIYNLSKEERDLEVGLLKYYNIIDEYMGKYKFSFYDDLLTSYIDDRCDISYIFRKNINSNNKPQIEIEISKYIESIDEYAKLLNSLILTAKKISNLTKLESSISESSFQPEIGIYIRILVL